MKAHYIVRLDSPTSSLMGSLSTTLNSSDHWLVILSICSLLQPHPQIEGLGHTFPTITLPVGLIYFIGKFSPIIAEY